MSVVSEFDMMFQAAWCTWWFVMSSGYAKDGPPLMSIDKFICCVANLALVRYVDLGTPKVVNELVIYWRTDGSIGMSNEACAMHGSELLHRFVITETLSQARTYAYSSTS